MRILFTGKNYSQGLKVLDPSSLAGTAQSLGYELVDSFTDSPELVICVDFSKSSLPSIREARAKGIRTVLIANEPKVVIPEHSQIRVLKEFDKVLKVGRPDTAQQLHWPQTWLPICENKERLNRVVLVNADKWSFVQGQQYWLRAAVSSQLANVDVFGFGWDRSVVVRIAHRVFELWRTARSRVIPSLKGLTNTLSKPKNYKGSISDKNAAMSFYKVALVVENSSEFLTEKLFDAWFAGCIPVYVGPPVESFGIPQNLVVQVQAPTLRAVTDGIDLALSLDHDAFSLALKGFLSSNAAQKWKAESALERILSLAV